MEAFWMFAGVTMVMVAPAFPLALFLFWLKVWRYRR